MIDKSREAFEEWWKGFQKNNFSTAPHPCIKNLAFNGWQAAKEDDRALMEMALKTLQGLHDDNAEYQRINNLGGYDNHWMRGARKVITELRAALGK